MVCLYGEDLTTVHYVLGITARFWLECIVLTFAKYFVLLSMYLFFNFSPLYQGKPHFTSLLNYNSPPTKFTLPLCFSGCWMLFLWKEIYSYKNIRQCCNKIFPLAVCLYANEMYFYKLFTSKCICKPAYSFHGSISTIGFRVVYFDMHVTKRMYHNNKQKWVVKARTCKSLLYCRFQQPVLLYCSRILSIYE